MARKEIRELISFIRKLIAEIEKDRLFFVAAYLCYNLLLSLFPFIIFLMSLFAILNLNISLENSRSFFVLPDIVYSFIDEIASVKSAGVLSFSLLLSVNRASAGLKSAVQGINACYERRVKRGWLKASAISIGLTLAFSFASIAAGLIFAFGNELKALIFGAGLPPGLDFIFGLAGTATALALMAVMIILIYRFGVYGGARLKSLLPGTVFTMLCWFAVSKLFGIFINNFSGLQRVYGSIAGVIALMYWLNIISLSLLIGAEINAIIAENKEQKSESGVRA
jgi:membrane protein